VFAAAGGGDEVDGVSLLIMTSMHELETLRKLLESALVQIQKPADPQTLH